MVRSSNTLLWTGLVVLTIAAYLPVWRNGYVDFDDELYITQNPQVLRGLTAEGFRWAWTTTHGNYWQPVSWLSLQFDAHLFASRRAGGPVLPAAAVHAHSLFWHGASVLFLFAVCLRLTGARGRSFLVAALFAVHPMHVESVAWAAERKDVLSVVFGLPTVWAYVRYLEKPGWGRYLGTTLAFLMSLLSKPMLITLPFVLLLLDYWPLRRMRFASATGEPGRVSVGRLLLEKVPLFILAVGIGIVAMVSRQRAGSPVSLDVLPLSARLANAATAYGWYLMSTVWPTRLAVLYPHPYVNWSVLGTFAGAGTLLVVTALAVWQARRRPWLIVGWLWFVGTLVPVIGLAQGGEQAWADRFCYFPHIGLFVTIVWGLGGLVEQLRLPEPVPGVVGALAVGCLGMLTWIQVRHWRDSVTLWEHAIAVTSDNHRAHLNLGKCYLDRGQLDRAETHFAEAVRLRPDAADYHYSYSVVLLTLGKLDETAEQLQTTLKLNPRQGDACHNLGTVRLRQGKPGLAVRWFRRALEMQPGSADTLAGLGLALLGERKRQEALRSFQAALQANPQEAEAWRGLGLVHLARGEPGKAIEAFGSALQARSALVNAHSELGLALGRVGEWDQAISSHLTAVLMQEQAGETC